MHSYYKYSIFCKLLLVYIRMYIVCLLWLHRAANLKVMFQENLGPSPLISCAVTHYVTAVHCISQQRELTRGATATGLCSTCSGWTGSQGFVAVKRCSHLDNWLACSSCVWRWQNRCWTQDAFKPEGENVAVLIGVSQPSNLALLSCVLCVCVCAYVRASVCVHFFSQLQL